MFCRQGYRVRLLTRTPAEYPWIQKYHNVEVVEGDLRDRDSLSDDMLAGCQYVVHAGGLFRFWGTREDFIETNTIGTKNILELSTRAQVEKFIHISSIAVIGQPDPTSVIDETYPPNPVEPYQESKLKAEQFALRYYEEHGLPIVVLRPGAYYGPMGDYAFNRLFIKDPMRGIIMQLDGGRYITFPAYVGDVAESILLGLEKGKPGEIYNICGDWISHKDAFSIVIDEANIRFPRLRLPGWLGLRTSQFLELVSKLTGREPFWPINMQSYVYNNWRVSNDKACRELGFQPLEFREGVRRTVEWYRAGKPEQIDELNC